MTDEAWTLNARPSKIAPSGVPHEDQPEHQQGK